MTVPIHMTASATARFAVSTAIAASGSENKTPIRVRKLAVTAKAMTWPRRGAHKPSSTKTTYGMAPPAPDGSHRSMTNAAIDQMPASNRRFRPGKLADNAFPMIGPITGPPEPI